LVLIGLWVRMGVAETPLFVKAEREAKAGRQRLPVAELFRNHKKATFIAILIATGAASYQMYGTLATSYAGMPHLPVTTILLFQFVNAVVALMLTAFFGWLSDKTGRRVLAITGSILVVQALYFLFWSLNNMYGPPGVLTCARFPSANRRRPLLGTVGRLDGAVL
jgi:MHS family shikimate/dehydroshikimate transporter-like MFS transporter